MLQVKRKLSKESQRSLRDLTTHKGWPLVEEVLSRTQGEEQTPSRPNSEQWPLEVAYQRGWIDALEKVRARLRAIEERVEKWEKKDNRREA